MSNVLYTCGHEGCGSRLFAAPGGTKLKCRHHPEDGYIQREDAAGNLFLYTEEKGKVAGKGKAAGRASGKTAIGKQTKAKNPIEPKVVAPGNVDVNPDGQTVIDVDALPEDLPGLRRVYEQVFGESPDKRFREAKLSTQIKVELERQAEEEAAQRDLPPESDDNQTVDSNDEEE